MTNPNYYADARSIAVRLFERGEFDWSKRIEDAIASGSTATEILMSLRYCLQQLLDSGIPNEEEGRDARLLFTALDEVLR